MGLNEGPERAICVKLILEKLVQHNDALGMDGAGVFLLVNVIRALNKDLVGSGYDLISLLRGLLKTLVPTIPTIYSPDTIFEDKTNVNQVKSGKKLIMLYAALLRGDDTGRELAFDMLGSALNMDRDDFLAKRVTEFMQIAAHGIWKESNSSLELKELFEDVLTRILEEWIPYLKTSRSDEALFVVRYFANHSKFDDFKDPPVGYF